MVTRSHEATTEEELVSRLMHLFARTLDHQGTCLETLELTYAQAKLIWRLEAGDTPSLKEAARRCGVDPSNLSSVVDQLIERGLMTSRPAQHDRRVRIVRLTGEGVRMRKRLLACLAENPATGSLSAQQQQQLLEILRDVACMSVARRRLAPVGETMFPLRDPFFSSRLSARAAAIAAHAEESLRGNLTVSPFAPSLAHRPGR